MMRRYNIYSNSKGMIVVTTYYGDKCIKGVSKCSPKDTFDGKLGIALATARCNVKLYKAKRRVALDKKARYEEIIERYKKLMDEAEEYVSDCEKNIEEAENEIEKYTK